MEIKPLVSIIIPVYNVDKFLPRCLDGLFAQTYNNFEAIIINDGSTDSSRDIALYYTYNDSRFKLIDKPNGGLSSARNEGIKYAKGKYIIFIDSDDWAEKNFIEELVKNISFYKSDFACCRLRYVNLEKNSIQVYGCPYLYDYLTKPDIIKDSLLVKNIHTAVWAKIYDASFIKDNNIIFKEGIVNEDTLFTSIVSLLANKVSFTNKVLFNSLERPGSISRSSQEKLFRDMKVALDEFEMFAITKVTDKNELKQYINARYVKSMLYNLLQSAQRLDLNKYTQMYNICMKETEYLTKLRVLKFLPIKHKLLSNISKYRICFYIIVKIMNFLGYKMH